MLTDWQNWAVENGFQAGFLLGGQHVDQGHGSASRLLGFSPFSACLAQRSLPSRLLLQTSLPRALSSGQSMMGITNSFSSPSSPTSRLS